MDEISQRQKYDLKRTIEDLKECKGKHTELISLYIPSTKQISDVSSYLKNELSESQNIKSKTTRKNVLSAIESILSRLRSYKKPPENGVVFFVGHKNIGSDQTSMISFVVEPPMPFKTFLYRCDSLFYLEPLEDMLIEKEVYGLLLIDRVDLLKYMTSQVPGKHGRGGQSQRRFERLTEIAAHEWFVKCGEKVSEIFSNEENIKGILVGGPGPTKKYFIDEKYLHYLIQDKIIDIFDTGYTDEFGLRELVSKASETMIDLEVAKEKSAMKQFLKEATKNEKSLAIYGEEEIRKALDMGAVDVLLLSDGLRKYRLTLKCSNCNFLKYLTIDKELIEDYTPPKCIKCDSSSTMEIIEKKDIIDELSEKTEKIGGRIILITRNSEEGDSLFSAFNGIAGILRYPIEI